MGKHYNIKSWILRIQLFNLKGYLNTVYKKYNQIKNVKINTISKFCLVFL